MLRVTLIYLALAALGFGVYYGIDYLPDSWKAWLSGKKTKLLSWVAIIGPEVFDQLTQIQGLGLFDYTPGEWPKRIMQAIGVLGLVCRMRTALESKG